eukprot:359430-Chlamydomonas_euryale.AAC.3
MQNVVMCYGCSMRSCAQRDPHTGTPRTGRACMQSQGVPNNSSANMQVQRASHNSHARAQAQPASHNSHARAQAQPAPGALDFTKSLELSKFPTRPD